MRRLILITLGLFGGALAAPLTLEDAWHMSTPATKTADLQWKAAELAHQKALSATGPAFQFSTNLNVSGNFSPPTDSTSGSVTGKASWDVTPWSSSALNLRSAERALLEAQLDRQTQKSEAFLQVTETYLQVEDARSQLELARLQLEVQTLKVQSTEQKRQLGQATQDALDRARLELLNAENTLKSRQNTVQSALQSLSLLLGMQVQEGETTDPALTLPAFSNLDVLLKKAERHPTVQKARLVLQERQEVVQAQQLTAALPDLTVNGKLGNLPGGWTFSSDFSLKTGKWGASANYPLGSSGQNSFGYAVGLQLNLPLDAQQPYTLQSLINQQELQEWAVQKALNTALQNITSQYHLYLEQVQQLEQRTLQLRQAGNQLEVQEKRLSLGLITKQDLLEAELAFKTAQENLKQTHRNAYLQALRLRIATGEPL
ncbi:TolC family protein [Deinococcus misasensis]|uniref:TolC family protein n=1 Tax=Deinococcus misasensis TaxID=392413 RepID=UPI00054FE192|nr:TolC family protein [Deinococcus misasensis]